MATELSVIHFIYVAVVFVCIALMLCRKDIVIICVLGTLLIGAIHTGSAIASVQVLVKALMVAGEDLFSIMLVISLMVAMLRVLNKMGADYLMFLPFKRAITGANQSYLFLGVVSYIAASLFWPTPATALVGTLLIPICIRAGLTPMAAAVAVNIFGHGMGLSGDLVIQGALKLSSTAANITVSDMYFKVALLSITTGIVAGFVGWLMLRKELKGFKGSEEWRICCEVSEAEGSYKPCAVYFAGGVPVVFCCVIAAMIHYNIKGGDANALIGGTALIILTVGTVVNDAKRSFDDIVTFLKEGFLFGIKIFAPVIPIAAFFFLGANSVTEILGEGAPKCLFDVGNWLAFHLPMGRVPVAFGNLIVGMIAGIEGSGFTGLPLTGSLAQAIGGPLGLDVSYIASVGQMGSIWTGGGCLVPWAFGLAATAGIAGVSPIELARRNFIPVLCGLFVSTVLAICLM